MDIESLLTRVNKSSTFKRDDFSKGYGATFARDASGGREITTCAPVIE